jgi:error-prone DNA polymerase
MAKSGLDDETAERVYRMIQAFAAFGFAESHSLAFALLVYASAWQKLHYPAIFLAGLLRAQPMGFYSAASLVSDAERHGVTVRSPSVQFSEVEASVEPVGDPGGGAVAPSGMDTCLVYDQPTPSPVFDSAGVDPTTTHRRDDNLATRLGLASVRGVGADTAEECFVMPRISPDA